MMEADDLILELRGIADNGSGRDSIIIRDAAVRLENLQARQKELTTLFAYAMKHLEEKLDQVVLDMRSIM